MLESILLIACGFFVAVTDLRTQRIPNWTLWLMLISAEFFEAEHRQNLLNHNKLSILILIGGCALHAITGGAIGMGDIKLFAVLSLLLPGFQAVLLAITFSTICGLLQSLLQRARAIPFAPGLLTGTLLVILLR